MRKLQHTAYLLFGVFILVIVLDAYTLLLAGKQVIYDLSLMPRTEALAYVQDIYLRNQQALEEQGLYVNPTVIGQILDSYLDEATELRWYENNVLSLSKYLGVVKYAVAVPVITLCIICEFFRSGEDGYKRVIYQD